MATLKRVAGAFIGSIIGASLVVAQDTFADADHKFEKLNPVPEAFDAEPQAFRVFKDLDKFRKCETKKCKIINGVEKHTKCDYKICSEKCYVSLLETFDELLMLEKFIQINSFKFGDRSQAEIYARKCNRLCEKFKSKIESTKKHRREDRIDAQDQIEILISLVNHHKMNIYGATSSNF